MVRMTKKWTLLDSYEFSTLVTIYIYVSYSYFNSHHNEYLLLMPAPICIRSCDSNTSVTLPLFTVTSCTGWNGIKGRLTLTFTVLLRFVDKKRLMSKCLLSRLASFSVKNIVNSVPTTSVVAKAIIKRVC